MGPHQNKQLWLQALLTRSHATGPGCRAALWLQERRSAAHDYDHNDRFSPQGEQALWLPQLFHHIVALRDELEGITLMGSNQSEPLDQYDALLSLTQHIKAETSFSVILYTSLTLDEIHQQGYAAILPMLDVLVANAPDPATKQLDQPVQTAIQTTAYRLPTMPNKQVYFLTNRYTLADMQAVPDAEVIITRDGDIIISGNNPVQW